MGAFWNPHGGVVVSEKKLSKKEVIYLKKDWLMQLNFPVNPVAKMWKKFKMTIILFSPLR